MGSFNKQTAASGLPLFPSAWIDLICSKPLYALLLSNEQAALCGIWSFLNVQSLAPKREYLRNVKLQDPWCNAQLDVQACDYERHMILVALPE